MVGISQAPEEVRKGPWTEQEDVQLVLCVNVYGDRRWDFVAKVSGLKVLEGENKQYRYACLSMGPSLRGAKKWFNCLFVFFEILSTGLKRTGKSCRLRWVNYLHPGLKRGKMTPHEERLVLELHSKWGNRWSRIARKLPGRTDNEIKNYWRTHMRKQAQERKKGGGSAAASATPSSSTTSTSTTTTSSGTSTSTSSSNFSKCFSSSVSIGNSPPTVESVPPPEKDDDRSFYDTGGKNKAASVAAVAAVPMASPVDEIWKDMDFFGDEPIKPVYNEYGYGGTGAVASSMASPAWEYFQVPLWTMDEEVEDISKISFFL